MILSAVIILVVPGFVLWKRKYGREFYERHREEIRMIPAFFCSGLFLAEHVMKNHRLTPEEQELREVFLVSREAEKTALAKRFSRMLLFGMAAAFCAFVLFLVQGRQAEIRAVRRPEFGETRQVELLSDSTEGEIPLRFIVSGRDPSADEYEAVFDRAHTVLQKEMLNGNAGLSSVRTNLKCPKETPEGIRVTYGSSRPEILSDNGVILAKELPEEGEAVSFLVTLRYGDFEKSYREELRILAAEEPVLGVSEQIQALLQEADRSSKDQEVLSLPEEFAGGELRFYPSRLSPYLILVLAAVLALWLYIFPGERMKERLKKRKDLLYWAYPGFVMRLSVLLRAGLSTRSAWERMLRDGTERGRRDEPLYEEMQLAVRNMEQGMSEEAAYLQFGHRCGLPSYRRLSNFLARNLRYGLSGAQEMLDQEVERALLEKKNAALRRGEEAGTKLLLPMLLLLVVVLVMIMIPAFRVLY